MTWCSSRLKACGRVALNMNWYLIAVIIKLHDYMGHIGVEIKNKGVLRSWKGNI